MTIVLSSVAIFLLNFLAMIFALRVMMRAVYVSPNAPLASFVIRVTRPFVRLFSLFVPDMGRFDLPAMVLMYIVVFIQIALFTGFEVIQVYWLQGLAFTALKCVQLFLNILFFAVLIRAFMSWIVPQQNALVEQVLIPLTYWIEAPFRRFIPDVGGVDLTPLIIIFGIKTFESAVLNPAMAITGLM